MKKYMSVLRRYYCCDTIVAYYLSVHVFLCLNCIMFLFVCLRGDNKDLYKVNLKFVEISKACAEISCTAAVAATGNIQENEK